MSEIPQPETSPVQPTPPSKPQHRGCMVVLFGFFGLSDAYDLTKWLVSGGFHHARGWEFVVHGFMFLTASAAFMALIYYRKPAFKTWITIAVCALVAKSVISSSAKKDWVGLAIMLGAVLVAAVAMLVQRWMSRRKQQAEAIHGTGGSYFR